MFRERIKQHSIHLQFVVLGYLGFSEQFSSAAPFFKLRNLKFKACKSYFHLDFLCDFLRGFHEIIAQLPHPAYKQFDF